MTVTRILLNWIGVILVIIGIGVLIMWDGIITGQLNKEFALSPTSQIYPIWKKSQDPVTVKMHIFNCTNTHELSKPNFKPHLVDVGPFVFMESNEKLDVEWNDNNTVSYHQKRTWHLDKENSANMDENITTMNIVPVAASYKARFLGLWASWSLSTSMKMLEKSIWTTHPARQFIFDGYSDPLLTIASALSGDKNDKMGFLYRRNGSSVLDGHFNIETGTEDISTVGLLRNWNYRNTSASYTDECANIQGYLGNFFKPGTTRNDTIYFFISEICRRIKLVYQRDEVVKGLTGYRFVVANSTFDNGETYEETKCNCGGECLFPPGVMNTSVCNKGSPFFVSYPYFLGADERYLQNVTGLDPSRITSEFYVVIEPNLGVPLELSAHMQYNMLLQPNSKISMFEDVPTIMYPMLYMHKSFTVNDESVQKLKLVLFLPTLGTICAVGFILLGLVILSVSLMPYFLSKLRRSPSIRKIDFTTDSFVSKELADNNQNEKEEKKEIPLSECEYEYDKLMKAAENVENLKDAKETDILT